MFGDLNRAEIIGNITSDLAPKYTGNGAAVLSFGVATNRRYKQQNSDEWQEEVTYHNVVVWGNQAESLAQRAKKGTRIYISGRLQTRSWEDNDGKKNYKTEITAENLILLDRYERGSASEGFGGNNKKNSDDNFEFEPKSNKNNSINNNVIDPDDLPF
jgi:single-strand DNA-binding protein